MQKRYGKQGQHYIREILSKEILSQSLITANDELSCLMNIRSQQLVTNQHLGKHTHGLTVISISIFELIFGDVY